MKTLTLIGECNRCGLCCVTAQGYRCQHLLTMGEMGTAGATACSVFHERVQGMPIVLWSPDGQTYQLGSCEKESEAGNRNILARGIGRGCSLTIKEA